MKKQLTFLIFGCVFLLVSGCKKDDPLTPVQLLAGTSSAGKSWMLVEQSLNGTLSPVGSCSADDITTFLPNFTYSFDEGASKCSTSDPQSYSGSWVLDQNDSHLLVTTDSEVVDFEVLMLTENVLSLKTIVLELEVITTFNPN